MAHKKQYKIGQLSALSGIHIESIRHYEKYGLLSPAQRAANGYRLYHQQHIEQLALIKTCRGLGFSLAEIAQLIALQKSPHQPCEEADRLVALHLELVAQKMAELEGIRAFLASIPQCQAQSAVEQCHVLHSLAQNKPCDH